MLHEVRREGVVLGGTVVIQLTFVGVGENEGRVLLAKFLNVEIFKKKTDAEDLIVLIYFPHFMLSIVFGI